MDGRASHPFAKSVPLIRESLGIGDPVLAQECAEARREVELRRHVVRRLADRPLGILYYGNGLDEPLKLNAGPFAFSRKRPKRACSGEHIAQNLA